MIERRGTFLKPVIPAAHSIPVPEPILSAEALRVAHEYVDYRLARGWTAADIMADLGVTFQPGWETLQTVVRVVAEQWQQDIEPKSRAVDEAARERAADLRKCAYARQAPRPKKVRVLRGRIVRDPIRAGA